MNEEGSTVRLTGPNGFIQVLIDLFKTKWRLITGKYNIEKINSVKTDQVVGQQ
jgi:hypothetical protein